MLYKFSTLVKLRVRICHALVTGFCFDSKYTTHSFDLSEAAAEPCVPKNIKKSIPKRYILYNFLCCTTLTSHHLNSHFLEHVCRKWHTRPIKTLRNIIAPTGQNGFEFPRYIFILALSQNHT